VWTQGKDAVEVEMSEAIMPETPTTKMNQKIYGRVLSDCQNGGMNATESHDTATDHATRIKKPSHTPGPFVTFPLHPEAIYSSVTKKRVATVDYECDRALFAAAPDLLAACEGALFALGECSVGNEKLSDLFPRKVDALRAALAKVTL
jgi:hypothetical protein